MGRANSKRGKINMFLHTKNNAKLLESIHFRTNSESQLDLFSEYKIMCIKSFVTSNAGKQKQNSP